LPPRGKLKVGISWKGSPGYAMDALRSANLKDFCPLFDLPGAAFYSLQVRPGPQEITNLGLDGFIADLGSTITDWRDTARAIAAMDVIVATDSANGHMAGALGQACSADARQGAVLALDAFGHLALVSGPQDIQANHGRSLADGSGTQGIGRNARWSMKSRC
jgi:hypothetical protein